MHTGIIIIIMQTCDSLGSVVTSFPTTFADTVHVTPLSSLAIIALPIIYKTQDEIVLGVALRGREIVD